MPEYCIDDGHREASPAHEWNYVVDVNYWLEYAAFADTHLATCGTLSPSLQLHDFPA